MNYVSMGVLAIGIAAASSSVQAKSLPRLYSFPTTTTASVSNALPAPGQVIQLSAQVDGQALGLYHIPGNEQIGGFVEFKVNGQAVGKVQVSTVNTPFLGTVSDLDKGCWAAIRDVQACTHKYAYGRPARVAINYTVPAGFTTASITATFSGDGQFSQGSVSAPVNLRNIPTFGEIRGMGNKCLDAEGANTAPGTAIQVWDCTPGTAQQLWTVKPNTSTITGVPSNRVLDIAGGTGDLTRKFSHLVGPTGQVVLADINESMLKVGRDRLLDKGVAGNIEFVQADAEKLPFPDNHFDCVTIAFGLRNVTHKEDALRSMLRVLKPGGRLLVLEFSKPTNALMSKVYDAYSFAFMPMVGKLILNDPESYRYLAESIRMHPNQETLKSMMVEAGFDRVTYHNMTAGIVALHRGIKP